MKITTKYKGKKLKVTIGQNGLICVTYGKVKYYTEIGTKMSWFVEEFDDREKERPSCCGIKNVTNKCEGEIHEYYYRNYVGKKTVIFACSAHMPCGICGWYNHSKHKELRVRCSAILCGYCSIHHSAIAQTKAGRQPRWTKVCS